MLVFPTYMTSAEKKKKVVSEVMEKNIYKITFFLF